MAVHCRHRELLRSSLATCARAIVRSVSYLVNHMNLATGPIDGLKSAVHELELYQIRNTDLDHIRAFGELVVPRLDQFVTLFYEWMETRPEYGQFFSDARKLARVQLQQLDYWREFFAAEVDEEYLRKRRLVGEAHARIGLPLQTYLAAMNVSLGVLTERLHDACVPRDIHAAQLRSVNKLMHLDISIVAQAFTDRVNRIIAEQNESLLDMSTPVTAIWDGILLLPVVGIIDSRRAQNIMDTMLAKILETGALVMILDISGVAVVDTAVANHLIKVTKATRLMGCETTLSGISPSIAQTMVELGIDVGEIHTTATLRDALVFAFRTTGVEIRELATRGGALSALTGAR